MSDANSMSAIERLLKDREHETMEELKSIKETAVAPALDGTIGRLTHMDAHQQHQIAFHGQRQLELQLERIRHALGRVKDGTYGICVECGVAITPARLEYSPETPFYVQCQGRLEREGRA